MKNQTYVTAKIFKTLNRPDQNLRLETAELTAREYVFINKCDCTLSPGDMVLLETRNGILSGMVVSISDVLEACHEFVPLKGCVGKVAGYKPTAVARHHLGILAEESRAIMKENHHAVQSIWYAEQLEKANPDAAVKLRQIQADIAHLEVLMSLE